MQRLEVSGAVRSLYGSLGVKGLIDIVVFAYMPFPILLLLGGGGVVICCSIFTALHVKHIRGTGSH
jgi:hypothetical protein